MDRVTFSLYLPNGDIEQFTAGCPERLEAIPVQAIHTPARRHYEARAAAGSLQASQQLGAMDELRERAAGQ